MRSPSKGINLGYYYNSKRLPKLTSPGNGLSRLEKTRGRITCRIVKVFTELKNIDFDWVGVQSLIQIERIGIRSGMKYLMANYYISSLVSKATTFANGIRYSLGN